MEFVDDLLTFVEVGLCLKSHGCHVANLSSQDFSAKNGDWWLPQRFIKTVLNGYFGCKYLRVDIPAQNSSLVFFLVKGVF